LILGGSRSGKSAFAHKLARDSGKPVLFVATAEVGDEEMAERIVAHQKKRPKGWRTLEISKDIGKQIQKNAGNAGVVIIDCLTLWVSNIISPIADEYSKANVQKAKRLVRTELNNILKCLEAVDAVFIIVSNEVGLGLVPPYPLGRLYRDLLGEVNQVIAQRAHDVYWMAAGIPVLIKGAKR
jgi:adenosylcobinamide kinase/adenosylcobinamide-phosphate guanylyltransferase